MDEGMRQYVYPIVFCFTAIAVHLIIKAISGLSEHKSIETMTMSKEVSFFSVTRWGGTKEGSSLSVEIAPWLCRTKIFGVVHHSWIYLVPSKAQLEEACRLISNGEGSLTNFGAAPEDVCDRVCPRCNAAETRFESYLLALRRARGESKGC